MQSRVQGDPNATRESGNVHGRPASEVGSSTSGPESEAGIESEEDPEDIGVWPLACMKKTKQLKITKNNKKIKTINTKNLNN